jgi:hypothetical protein
LEILAKRTTGHPICSDVPEFGDKNGDFHHRDHRGVLNPKLLNSQPLYSQGGQGDQGGVKQTAMQTSAVLTRLPGEDQELGVLLRILR